MRDFLKKLFSSKDPEPEMMAFDAIPALLKNRRDGAKARFDAATEEPVRNIRNAAAQLRHITNSVAGAEHDPKIHPKLKSIAKTTLPQFVRSMNVSLAKEFPDDPDAFYAAVVECVKGCLNSMKGPGRYLQIVFPDEMKSARAGIDAMGREMNVFTKALGTFRNETAEIDVALADFAAIMALKADLQKAVEKEHRIADRIRETNERIAAIGRERADLLADPRMAEAEGKRSALADLEKQREETSRAYAAVSMTAAHVLRKAEKIAARQHHPGEIAALRHAMTLLSDHELPDGGELESALAAAYPVAARMIGAGEIPLKNREEKNLFSDGSHFCTEVSSTCRRLHDRENAAAAAQQDLHRDPALTRLGSLEREENQLRAMAEKEVQAQKDLVEWEQKTADHIPVLTEELRKKVGVMVGKNVQFS